MGSEYDYTELIGYKIIQGEVVVKRRMLGLFSEMGYDITFEQWTVLNVVYVEPGLIQSEIAVKTYKDKTNVTRILDVLCKRGYVVRENNGKDRRSLSVYLTDSGRKMFDELIPCVKELNTELMNGVSDSDLGVFTSVLNMICDNAR